jgi:hypothetical protein
MSSISQADNINSSIVAEETAAQIKRIISGEPQNDFR